MTNDIKEIVKSYTRKEFDISGGKEILSNKLYQSYNNDKI